MGFLLLCLILPIFRSSEAALTTVPVTQTAAVTTVPASQTAAVTTVPVTQTATVTTVPASQTAAVTTVPASQTAAVTTVPVTQTAAVTTVPASQTAAVTTVPASQTAAVTTVPVTQTVTTLPASQTAAVTTVPATQTAAITTLTASQTADVTTVPVTQTAAVTTVPASQTAAVTTVPSSQTAAVTTVPVTQTAAVTTLPASQTAAVTTVPATQTAAVTFLTTSQTAAVTTLTTSQTGTNYPDNLACTTLNSTVLHVTWDQATDASVAGYHLDVERVDGLRIEFGLPSIDLNHISFDTYTIYGLGKFGTYNITVHAYFTSGANGTDFVVSCQTSSDVPDASNFNLSCNGISTSEISCTWNALSAVYWNGIPQGYELQYIGFVNAYYTTINLSTSDLSYTISGLGLDMWYIIQLRTISDAGYSPYTSDHAKTQGLSDTGTESKTRYYCYETIPGRLTWEWEEMPCTVYVGIILAFMLLSLIFMVLSCLLGCCKGKGDTKNNVAVNIFNEEGRDDERDLYDDFDDDDEDDAYEKTHRAYSDDDDDDFDYDSEGNPTEAAKAAKKKRKMREAYGEARIDDTEEDVSDEEVISEEESVYETSEVETEQDEEYESSEDDGELDEKERIAKKEKKLTTLAAAKGMRERKREEKAKRKAEKDAERAERKAMKDQERAESKSRKDQERADRNLKREEEKAKLKADREEKSKQVAMQKAERKERAKQKAEQNQKNTSGMKSKNVIENERKGSEEESESETSEYDSEDYDSVEDSSSDDAEMNGRNKEQKVENKTKTNLKMKHNQNKTFAGKAILSTINENRRYKKKNKLSEKQSDAKFKNKSDKTVKSKQDNTKDIKDKQIDRSDESYDDSDAEFYEDWDPDVVNNPETNVSVVNANGQNLKSENLKVKWSKSSHSKTNGKNKEKRIDKNKNDTESQLDFRNKRSNDSDGYDSDDDNNDSDDEDYDSYDYINSSDESYGENLKNKGKHNIKNKISIQSDKRKAYTLSDDSGRGSVMSSDWGDSNNTMMVESDLQSKKRDTKTGFFGSLFGKSSNTSVLKRNPVEKNSDSVFKTNNETNKTKVTNDWDSDDNGNTGGNALNSKQQNKSTTWQGNPNNSRNKNNNGYPSSEIFRTGNSISNEHTASNNVNTDSGDWGSDDNDNENEHPRQNHQNSHGSCLSHTNKSTVKNIEESGLTSSFTQGNRDDRAWSKNHTRFNNSDNKHTNSITKVQAASLQVNQGGLNYLLGTNVNLNKQVLAQYGNLVSVNQNGHNTSGSNFDGQFDQAGDITNLKGHDRTDNNKHYPTVYLDPSHDGQVNATFSTMDSKGTSWPINSDEFGDNWNENIHYKNLASRQVSREEQLYSSNETNIQNMQHRPENSDYNFKANRGIPENGHTVLQNGQSALGGTATSRNPAFGANNRSQTHNTQFSPMKDLSVHDANGTHNSSGTASESSDSGHWPKATDNQNKSRKLVSFRPNPAFAFGDPGKNPGIVSSTGRHKGPYPGTNSDGSESAGYQTSIMPDADIVLPDTVTGKRSLSPVGKCIVNKPAWGNTKSNTPNSERMKGSKTPVEDLSKRHKRMSLTEPEPVLATDRLAKKFPFLSTAELDKAKGREGDKGNYNESSTRKNKSDSSLPTFFSKGTFFQSSKNEAVTGSYENSKEPVADGATLNPETRDKVFYGFGVGKWRLAAAKWLNIWKMKRRPVKTAKSSWD